MRSPRHLSCFDQAGLSKTEKNPFERRKPMRLRSEASVLFLLLICDPLLAQNKPRQDTFTERVEVKVRTVVAVVTDTEGKHLASAPSAADLEVLEDGAPAEIVGVEPLPRPKTSSPEAAKPPEVAGLPKIADSLAQVLYVDPQFVYRGSANLYVRTLLPMVEALVARGPLQIVVAGPSPRNLLPATSDPALLRAALKTLPHEATGMDSLFESRRRLLDSPPANWEMVARVFIARDIERIESYLEKLELWAATNRPASPTILYLLNDGFELDPTDFYLTCRRFCPPSAIQERESFGRHSPTACPGPRIVYRPSSSASGSPSCRSRPVQRPSSVSAVRPSNGTFRCPRAWPRLFARCRARP